MCARPAPSWGRCLAPSALSIPRCCCGAGTEGGTGHPSPRSNGLSTPRPRSSRGRTEHELCPWPRCRDIRRRTMEEPAKIHSRPALPALIQFLRGETGLPAVLKSARPPSPTAMRGRPSLALQQNPMSRGRFPVPGARTGVGAPCRQRVGAKSARHPRLTPAFSSKSGCFVSGTPRDRPGFLFEAGFICFSAEPDR